MQLAPLLQWTLALLAVTAVGAPIAAALFGQFPDRGAPFALPVGLLATVLAAFWIGQVWYGPGAVALAVLVPAGVAAALYRRGFVPDWPAVGRGFGVFLAGFLFLLAFRVFNATVTPLGGEHFLHYGLSKALTRAGSLPPEDIWFAGEPLAYYYGAELHVASLSALSAVPVERAFNLMVLTFYGLLVVAAYGLARAVAGESRRLAGVLGAFFVAVAGATTTAVRLAFGLLPEDVAVRYGRAVFEYPAIRGAGSGYADAVAQLSHPDTWGWWYTRYVVEGTIQEFPLYSFVVADLSPHAVSMGYVLLAAALSYSYYRLPAERRWTRRAVLLAGLGSVAGLVGFTNTWALPTVAGLTWLAAAGAEAHPATLLPPGLSGYLRLPDASTGGSVPARAGGELWRLLLAVVPAGAVTLVGVALSSPFMLFGAMPQNDGIGLFPPKTDLGPFLLMYGGLLVLFAVFLLARSRPALAGRRWTAVGGVALAAPWLALVSWFPVLCVTAPFLAVAWWLRRTDRAGFEAVLLVAGVGLLLAMDLVYAKVAPQANVRWNTAHKVSVQAWTLAGVAAGIVAARLLQRGRASLADLRETGAGIGPALRKGPTLAACALVVAIVLASILFPVLTAGMQVGDAVAAGEEPTLSAVAGHEDWKDEQVAAFRWLDRRSGTPTIVEAPGQPYQWTSPASTFTGLPSLVGWVSHEENYRPDGLVEERVRAARVIYTGNWTDAAAALRRYDVTYIYVGPVERERYGADLRSLSGLSGVTVAYDNSEVTIYRVRPTGLPAP